MKLLSCFFLTILLSSGEIFSQNKFVLQPNSKNGKDAVVWYINSKNTRHGDVAEKNFGKEEDFKAMAWSFQGSLGEKRSLIEFDLGDFSKNTYITSAYLSLYANRKSGDAGNHGHSSLNGKLNECLLQRIIEPWVEYKVTWNNQPITTHENEVIIPKSESSFQNYKDIDVTQLVRDMINNPKNSFGFMMSVKDAHLYKSMIFASSDYPIQNLHPKLVINYRKNHDLNYEYINLNNYNKKNDRYVIVIYDENSREINRIKGFYFKKLENLKSGIYHFNLIKNKKIRSVGKFIIY